MIVDLLNARGIPAKRGRCRTICETSSGSRNSTPTMPPERRSHRRVKPAPVRAWLSAGSRGVGKAFCIFCSSPFGVRPYVKLFTTASPPPIVLGALYLPRAGDHHPIWEGRFARGLGSVRARIARKGLRGWFAEYRGRGVGCTRTIPAVSHRRPNTRSPAGVKHPPHITVITRTYRFGEGSAKVRGWSREPIEAALPRCSGMLSPVRPCGARQSARDPPAMDRGRSSRAGNTAEVRWTL